ncbi:MAG: protein TolR [Bdellovibrionota bacterium]
MAFAQSDGGEKKSRVALSEINVTPLVDVMLVLLIIFMVTAPMMQQGFEVDLPEASAAGVSVSEDPLLLVIQKNRKIYLGSAQIPMDNLSQKISAIMETRKNKQVNIQADKTVDYGVVAEAMGELKFAGINSIGLITLPKSE